MELFNALWLGILFWIVLNCIRIYLCFYATEKWQHLQQSGLSIGLFSLTYSTTCWNVWLNSFKPSHILGPCTYQIYRQYFAASVWISLALVPYALYIILSNVYRSFVSFTMTNLINSNNTSETVASESSFMLIIPGVNLSEHEYVYVVLATAIVSFIHELGHAMAANNKEFHLESVGVSLYLCFPVTFVAISTDRSHKRSIFDRLQVVTAGLLNNVTLCVLVLVSYWCNPISLLYTRQNGLVVLRVDEISALAQGINAIRPGDVITHLNGKPLSQLNDWRNALYAIHNGSKMGYCVPDSFLDKHIENFSPVCNMNNCCTKDSSALCFVLKQSSDLKSPFEPNINNVHCDDVVKQQFATSNLGGYYAQYMKMSKQPEEQNTFEQNHHKVCLNARSVTNAATHLCNGSCVSTYFGRHYCLLPYSPTADTRMVALNIEGHKKAVLFWGPVRELYYEIELIASKPRFWWIPVSLLEQSNTFHRYLFTISFSLILFNLLPFSPFDGYHMVSLYAEMFFSKVHTRKRFLFVLHLLSSILVFLCFLVALLQLRKNLHL